MNQYEIELRDKFAQIALVEIFRENSTKPFKLNVEAIPHHAYVWADKLMAERQKHLDAIEIEQNPMMANREIMEIYTKDFSKIPHSMGHTVQGTECER